MRAALLGVLAALAPATARADAPPADPENLPVRPIVGKDIVVETQAERSSSNIIMVSSIAGAGVLLGGLGVYFHLDSRTQSQKVSADAFTSKPWTAADQAAVDQAASDRTKATVFYAAGGALIIGAIVLLIITDPPTERTVIHPHVGIAPTPGGGMVAGMWSF